MDQTRHPVRIDRRDFLAASALSLVAAACRQPKYDPAAFALTGTSPVGLFPAPSYAADFAEIISRGIREFNLSLRGKRVLLKPNLVEYEPGTAINTHPLVIAGAAIACRRAGATEVVVAEGPGHRRDIEYLLVATGLRDQLRDTGLRFADLNHDDVRVVPLRSWFTGMREIALPVELLQADVVISMPKLKTHHWAGMTCSMKNLFGTVPGAVYGWPKNVLHMHGIVNSIVDLTATIRPQFVIVDAVTAMEGDGPIMGRPRPLGLIAMGTDPVAVDATCARIIGLAPAKLTYLEMAGTFLGNIEEPRIEQRGERIARYATKFEIVSRLQNLIAG